MRNHLAIILIFIFIALGIFSAERKKVGLVLGGGGAKGAAHVGVLKVLEDAKIPIDYIAGTSIGAIIGGLYSIGYRAEVIDSLIRVLDWTMLMSNQSPQLNRSFRAKTIEEKYLVSIPLESAKKLQIPAGFIVGQNIMNLFSNLTIGYQDSISFNKLPIPFSCVATNLVDGKAVILSSGSLPFCMRASMSIPGVFAPVEIDSMILVDGGVLNNFPTNVVRDMGAEIIIGVDLTTGKLSYKALKTLPGMINELVDITGRSEYQANLKGLNLYLNPPLKGYGSMDFNKASMDTMYLRGLRIAEKKLPEILALKALIYNGDTSDVKIEMPVKPLNSLRDSFLISNIELNGIPHSLEHFIRKKIRIKPDNKITLDQINRSIAILDGMGTFSYVTFQLLGKQQPYKLVYNLVEQSLNNINFGFRFDTEDMASILFNTTFYHNFFKGSVFSLTGRLSTNPYLLLQYDWRPDFQNKLKTAYQIGYTDFPLYKGSEKVSLISYLWQTGDLSYSFQLEGFNMKSGVRWEYFGYKKYLYTTEYQVTKVKPESFIKYYLKASLETYDKTYFPSSGVWTHTEIHMITNNFIDYKHKSPIGVAYFDFATPLPIARRFYIIPFFIGRGFFADIIPNIYSNFMGGNKEGRYLPQQIDFPGINNTQIFKNIILAGELSLRYRWGKNHYTFLSGGYAKNATKITSFFDGDNIWAASAKQSYDSFFGPLSLQANYSNREKRLSVYVNLGYNF